MKPFRSYQEQIKILKKRNLIFNGSANVLEPISHSNGIILAAPSNKIVTDPSFDPTKKMFFSFDDIRKICISNNISFVIDILKTYGYYNIINLYKSPFVHNGKYDANIDFLKLFSLHEIDSEIKGVLYLALFQAEQKLKTTIAYEFAKKYGPFDDTIMDGYIDPYLIKENFNNKILLKNKKEKCESVINTLNSIIDYNANYPPFAHYSKVHGHIPIWVLINKLTFGNVKNFYTVLKIQDQIAQNFSLSPSELRIIINLLHQVRNDCAHGENFFMQKYPSLKSSIKLVESFKSTYGFGKNKNMGNLFKVLIALKFILPRNNYPQLCNSIDHSIFELMGKKTVIPPISEYLMHQLGIDSYEDSQEKLNYLINYKINK